MATMVDVLMVGFMWSLGWFISTFLLMVTLLAAAGVVMGVIALMNAAVDWLRHRGKSKEDVIPPWPYW